MALRPLVEVPDSRANAHPLARMQDRMRKGPGSHDPLGDKSLMTERSLQGLHLLTVSPPPSSTTHAGDQVFNTWTFGCI
jgi:hypothetical protein